VVELIEAGEFHVFHDALRFALALAFSSKNAGEFLKPIPLDVCAAERGLLYDFIHEEMTLPNPFGADISGRDFEHGKPHPMIFLTAPQEPGFPPDHYSWSRTPPPRRRRARWARWKWQAELQYAAERGWRRPGGDLHRRGGGECSERGPA
jgi:hypothetical protein